MNNKTRFEYGPEEEEVFLITDAGYALRVPLSEFRISKRGTMGLQALVLTEKNGHIVAAKKVQSGDLLLILTRYGMSNIVRVDDFLVSKRKRKGVKAINLRCGDEVVAVI